MCLGFTPWCPGGKTPYIINLSTRCGEFSALPSSHTILVEEPVGRKWKGVYIPSRRDKTNSCLSKNYVRTLQRLSSPLTTESMPRMPTSWHNYCSCIENICMSNYKFSIWTMKLKLCQGKGSDTFSFNFPFLYGIVFLSIVLPNWLLVKLSSNYQMYLWFAGLNILWKEISKEIYVLK